MYDTFSNRAEILHHDPELASEFRQSAISKRTNVDLPSPDGVEVLRA